MDTVGLGSLVVRGAVATPPGHCRVCCVSDTHCQMADIAGRLPDGDVLLHTGDVFLLSWDQKGRQAARDCVTQFGQALAVLPASYTHVVVVAGNHDFAFQTLGAAAVQDLLSAVVARRRPGLQVVYLQDEGVVLSNGLSVYGSPVSVGCRHYNAFQPASSLLLRQQVAAGLRAYQSNEASHVHRSCAGGPVAPHVVMLHGPPDPDTREVIMQACAPSLVVYGHSHTQYGVTGVVRHGAHQRVTAWVNAASVDAGYAPVHRPIVMNIQLDATVPPPALPQPY